MCWDPWTFGGFPGEKVGDVAGFGFGPGADDWKLRSRLVECPSPGANTCQWWSVVLGALWSSLVYDSLRLESVEVMEHGLEEWEFGREFGELRRCTVEHICE